MSRKPNAKSFIFFQTNGGKKYAVFCPFDRKHGGKDVYLGTVVDEDEGIFYNRTKGYFRFTVKNGKSELSPGELEYFKLIRNHGKIASAMKPNLSLDFGDVWFLDQIMDSSGLKNLFRKVCPENTETLLSLIAFKLLDNAVNSYAQEWYDGSYARYIYPNAQLASQRISEFVKNFGKEENLRVFFNAYFAYLKTIPKISENILIDSTGLPNDICFEYSAINNHNGVISREARLIFVVERNTGFPVYFRYVAGNIVDVTTLRTTLKQLKAQGLNVSHGIMDAGYYSEKNIRELFRQDVPFLIRLPARSLSDNLIKEHGAGLFSTKYVLKHGNRLIFMKKVSIELFDNKGFAYVAIDVERQKDEQSKYINKALDDPKMKEKMSDEVLNLLGYFVLISSQELQTEEVLPLYYMRQTIEQTFDFTKNDVDLLPLRTHDEETLRGHLLLSFMATVVFITVNRLLKNKKKLKNICAKMAFHAMHRIKCNVYERNIVTTEANRIASLVLNELKMPLPVTIDL
jgi:hypothetical protein